MNDAYADMSLRYKNQKTHIHTDAVRAAYVEARLPATKAVVKAVIDRFIDERSPDAPNTILDLGAGPGTVALALEDFEAKFTLIEKDSGFIEISKNLLKREHNHIHGCILKVPYEPHDWVIASYSLNEILCEKFDSFLLKSWNAADKFLILIEPGTPQGFKNILKAREFLIKNGAHITLPCAHQLKCPLQETDVWCHFSKRLARTKEHKNIKGGILGYEDEKYCYLIASKTQVMQTPRIISTPKQYSGHLEISTCEMDGEIHNKIYSKSKDLNFKQMKKKEWGDSCE